MLPDIAELKQSLADALGQHDDEVAVVCEMDPDVAERFVALAAATRRPDGLGDKARALINVAISATVTDLKEKYTRVHIANALRHGATREEICETLQITSVLGIHGFISGAQILLEVLGGFDELKAHMSSAQVAKGEAAKADFLAARGDISPVWEANAYLSPGVISAYAAYSGLPWKNGALSPKLKELIYFAIDLTPSHLELIGAANHLRNAIHKYGATVEEVVEVLELLALVGFQTQLLALPILKDELQRLRGESETDEEP